MPDNARDIIHFLMGRYLVPEEAERIIAVVRQRVRDPKPTDESVDAHSIKRGVIAK